MYTVPAKILYLQRYWTDFRNLRLSSKTLRVGIWVESVRCAGILLLQWQGENFAHRHYLKFPTFNMYTVPAKILPLQSYSTGFRNLASARRCWGWAFGCNVSAAQVFCFCNGKVKTLRLDNIWIFPLSTRRLCQVKICTLGQLKSYISKGIEPVFENLASARRCWGLGFGCKVSGAQVFYFCKSKVKTLRIHNIWNFQLSTCTLCQLKSYNSKAIQPVFENLTSARRCWDWHLGVKFQVRRYFTFAMARSWLCASTTFQISHFQPVQCDRKNPISPKVFNRFSKTLLQLEDVDGGIRVEIFKRGGILVLEWQGENLRIDNVWKFPLSTCTIYREKSYISKGIQQIFENIASARRCWGWHLGRMFQVRRYFTFAMARWKFCASRTFEISRFQPVHCAR